MICPVCPDSELRRRRQDGVTIDTCPRCRGAWLEAGALEQFERQPRRRDVEPPYDREPVPSRARWDDDDDDDEPFLGERRRPDQTAVDRRRPSMWRRLFELFD